MAVTVSANMDVTVAEFVAMTTAVNVNATSTSTVTVSVTVTAVLT